jgi:selenocysteine lyase/cysteine desulfurase
MMITRRDLLAQAGTAAALGAGLSLDAPLNHAAASLPMPDASPRNDFAIPGDQTYLNSAFIHPMPIRAAAAVQGYLATRTFQRPRERSGDAIAAEVKQAFARLINATPASVSLVQSTSVAENLVVNGLGLPASSNTVVTDALHFDGSLVMYGELAKRGLGVSFVRPRDWRITIDDLAAAIDSRTKLVALSLVSWYNGFQHDLAAVCQMAHDKGAYVYADLVQGAGNTPIDVQASGVDFCGCSSFKWLMGDFGVGFLYVREDLLDRVIHRTQVGYQQADIETHYLDSEPPTDQPITWTLHQDATGHFEVGTYSQAAVNALAVSLPYIERLGVANIHAARQPLLRRLHEALPRLGWTSITPPESTSALAVFTLSGAESRFAARLQAAKISVSLYGDRMRVAPAVFNSADDIEKLIVALG